MADVHVFVAARGNAYMRDIAGWIAEAAALTGRRAVVVDDRLPENDGSANLVVAPHEFFELFHAPKRELRRAATCSVCVCTEQPGTTWFGLSLDAARLGLVAYDINEHGVDALRAAGVDAHRLQLGAVPSMVAPPQQRSLDVLFLGALDDRRGAVLAELAGGLCRRDVELRLFTFERPVSETVPGLVFGPDKYALLAGSRTLLNIHRGGGAATYFEWARMVEAMANGCVVVSEPSSGCAPLVPGVHLVAAPPDDIGRHIEALLDDPARRHSIAEAARLAVTDDLALHRGVGRMLDHVEAVVLPKLSRHVRRGPSHLDRWRFGATHVAPPIRLPAFKPHLERQRGAKRLALAENDAMRDLDRLSSLLRWGCTEHDEHTETPAFAAATPEVSVIVSLYNYADVVTETLDSIVASEAVELEIIVVEDHATDDSRAVVRTFLDEHPDVPMLLVAKDVNEGLAAARNTGFEHARAELVMVLDADNLVYPTCLRRLADALAADQTADGAYAILEDFGVQRNIRSALPWDVPRLCTGNYIDAQAMVRRTSWEQLGGYRGDDAVHGWEDWDLWLRVASTDGHLVLVAQVLGRYRVQPTSMIALTNLAADDARDALRDRYPKLPWPVAPGR